MTPQPSHHPALRALFAAAALLAVLALAGCGGAPPVKLTLADSPLPNYTGVDPSVSATQQIGGRTIEVVTFNKQNAPGTAEKRSGNNSKWTEKYAAWFKKDGWQLVSENQEVTSMRWIFAKGPLQCTMTFSFSQGLTLVFSAPPKQTPGQAAATPQPAPPAAGAPVTR